jgi:hypothetical protein
LRIIGLARSLPRGQLARDVTGELSTDDEGGPAHWTLDAARLAAVEVFPVFRLAGR